MVDPRTPVVVGVGQFTESVRFIAPDQTTVLRKSEVKFGMKDPNINATTVTVFVTSGAAHSRVRRSLVRTNLLKLVC